MAEANVQKESKGPVAPTSGASIRLRPIPFDAVRIASGFWAERQRVNREVSIPLGVRRLHEAGNLDNLQAAAKGTTASYCGPLFMDSDIYKMLEALAWEHGRDPSVSLLAEINAISTQIRKAQAADGYLNSYVQVVRGMDSRYTELAMGHELYCYGHLLQAAVAAHRVAPNDDLWQVALSAADHLSRTFGHGDLADAVEGHPVIEMALVELYRDSGNPNHLGLAEHLVKSRGRQSLRFAEREPTYFSDRVPARDATTVEGHAVRALYFASGVADVVAEGGDFADGGMGVAQLRQWEHMVQTKTYLTGGLGSRWNGEAFGDPYELPPDRAYCETCAAIGSIQWSWRLLLSTGDCQYADLIERTLYNGFAAATSSAGDEFFYVNALQVRSDAEPDDHRNPALGRHGWYDVACCPPNIMRTVSSLGSYLASRDEAGLQIHQYAGGSIHVALDGGAVELEIRTAYPWDGKVELDMLDSPHDEWTLSLRVPAWCTGASVSVSVDDEIAVQLDPLDAGSYVQLHRCWHRNDRITLQLPMPARLTAAGSRVDAVRGCVAIERGPLVYCVEQVDQAEGVLVDDLVLVGRDLISEWRPDVLGGVVTIAANGYSHPAATPRNAYRTLDVSSDVDRSPGETARDVVAVPYCVWGNRNRGAMRVWLPQEIAANRR